MSLWGLCASVYTAHMSHPFSWIRYNRMCRLRGRACDEVLIFGVDSALKRTRPALLHRPANSKKLST